MRQKKANLETNMSLELKYCERCGGLWLRPTGSGQVYCIGCARQMAELPPPTYDARRVVEDELADEFLEEQMFVLGQGTYEAIGGDVL